MGFLTVEQRREKVAKYLEKKKNRKWKHIRYNIRKDLADKRERIQGRFVKTNKCLSHSDIIARSKFNENLLDNNSGFSGKNSDLSLSLTNLGKRADKIDLLDDSSIPNNISMDSIEMKDPHF